MKKRMNKKLLQHKKKNGGKDKAHKTRRRG
jgi:hypothetical protein